MQPSSAYEQPLNPQQRAAIEHDEGPLLVVAGAGTGKTRVITERIRWLLETHPEISGENILGLTFTDKAAGEMKWRVVRAVGERARGVWLGTFHSFSSSVILAELRPGLRIIDEIDHWILLRRRLSELQLEHYKRLADPGQFLTDFLKFFSRCQDELVMPDDYQRYVDRLREAFEYVQPKLDPDARQERELEIAGQQEVARAYRISDRLLREQNLATFGHLLLESVALLRANPEALRRLQERFRYVLVDEFQDTNIAQIELLWLLAGGHRNLFAVGDDDQAIYRFRGASFGSFKVFAEKFLGPPASGKLGPDPALTLTQNYRSTGRILRVAGQSIAQNRDRYIPNKRLVTENPEGEKVRIAEFATPEEEAHWIARELEQLHRAGHRWGEFGVLYRQHTHREKLVSALVAAGIPFAIKNLSILSNVLVRDVVAYLRLIQRPAEEVACARVLATPYWGLEPVDLVRLAQRAGKGRGRSLLDELANPQGGFAFVKDSKRAAELPAWLAELRKQAESASASEFLGGLIRELGLGLFASEADRKCIDRLVRFVQDWEMKGEAKSLDDFLEYLDYFREAGGQINLDEEAAEDAVQLMTAHAAKGLEFGHVFVIRLSNGAFPPWPRPRVLEFPEALMKEEKPQGDFRIQEERRLFYVAMTRARRRLTLATVVNRRSGYSPFLEDILLAAPVKARDLEQLAPKVSVPAAVPLAGSPMQQPRLFGPAGPDARAYSRIGRWAETFHPPLAEPLVLSASAIDTYQTCPLKYLLQQVWGLRGGPHASMTFGNVMHTTIRQFVGELRKGRRMAFEDVVSIYQREWSSAGFRDGYQEEEYRKAGLEQLEAFYGTYSRAPADVLHQEKYFELPLDPNVVVTGRMDQINRLGTDQAEIVDYKTGRPKAVKDAEKSLQLSLYALATREVLELKTARLVFYNLTTNEAVAGERDEKALEQARQTVAEVADQIRAGHFPARPGFACRSCEFQPICPAHEQPFSDLATES